MSLGWKTNDVMPCFLSYFWVMKKEDTMYNKSGRYKKTTNLNNSTQIQDRLNFFCTWNETTPYS